MGIPHLQA